MASLWSHFDGNAFNCYIVNRGDDADVNSNKMTKRQNFYLVQIIIIIIELPPFQQIFPLSLVHHTVFYINPFQQISLSLSLYFSRIL